MRYLTISILIFAQKESDFIIIGGNSLARFRGKINRLPYHTFYRWKFSPTDIRPYNNVAPLSCIILHRLWCNARILRKDDRARVDRLDRPLERGGDERDALSSLNLGGIVRRFWSRCQLLPFFSPFCLSSRARARPRVSFVERHPRLCQPIRAEINQKGTIDRTWASLTPLPSLPLYVPSILCSHTYALFLDQNIK